jgi:hypothetical protein
MKILMLVFIVLVITSLASAELTTSYICEETYISIKSNIPNVNLIQEILYQKNISVSENLINYYKNNWENLCSELTKKIINPSKLCERIYYLTISTNYNYTDLDISSISLEQNVSKTLIKNYIDNYNESCYMPGYSNKLPDRVFSQTLINQTTECNLNISNIFEPSIQMEAYLGKRECNQVIFWNHFFKIDQFNKEFKVIGIRIFPLVCLIFLIIVFFIIRSFTKSNKHIDKLMEKN